jgi:hypothetical protein
MSRSLESFAAIGRELKHINEPQLWLARYSSFLEFCHQELDISWQRAYWFIKIYHRLQKIQEQLPGVEELPTEVGHMRLLEPVPDELVGACGSSISRKR